MLLSNNQESSPTSSSEIEMPLLPDVRRFKLDEIPNSSVEDTFDMQDKVSSYDLILLNNLPVPLEEFLKEVYDLTLSDYVNVKVYRNDDTDGEISKIVLKLANPLTGDNVGEIPLGKYLAERHTKRK